MAAGFSIWREGDEQHSDWRQGGRSQFLFLEIVSAVLGFVIGLAQVGLGFI
jgi:hypothetical protein